MPLKFYNWRYLTKFGLHSIVNLSAGQEHKIMEIYGLRRKYLVKKYII